MGFDLIYLVILLLAAWNGYRKGLVVGLFSLFAVVIGLAAAMKLSVVVAGYIGRAVKVSEEWLPLVSFLLVFIIVIILVRLGAKAIEKGLQFAMLGWLNRLGGILLYLVIYTIVFSILLFYLKQMGFLRPESLDESSTYSFVQPWGPKLLNGLGSLLPWFRNMFAELQDFFGNVGEGIH
jgi:membrane protein required for colicin V production